VKRTLRELRSQLRTLVLLAALMIFGLAVGAYLVVHQRIVWPSWVPFAGQHEFVLNAQVSEVAGVLPGQGQAVTIAGVDVGEITGVSLRQGLPTVGMEIDPQYANRICSNATVLLRPKTGLNDMVAELDPGSPGAGARRAAARPWAHRRRCPRSAWTRSSRSWTATPGTSSSCSSPMPARRSRTAAAQI
jgi:phospholipid/cholesterol/gamma-HCH transport system substrate-binding protein